MELQPRFPVEFDGQEAQIMITALLEHADRCHDGTRAAMDRLLAIRIAGQKKAFHNRTYAAMAVRYDLPAPADLGDTSVQEASQQAKADSITRQLEVFHRGGSETTQAAGARPEAEEA